MTPEYLILFTARADLVDWQSWAARNNPWQPLDGASTPSPFYKERFISNVFETSQSLRKVKQQTSFLLKK